MDKILMIFAVSAVVLISGCKKETYVAAFERGEQAVLRGDYATAASAFRNATRAKANSREAFYFLGQAELMRGNYRKAADAFLKAATLTTDNSVDALEGLGRARMMQKKYDEADKVYNHAMQAVGRTPRLLAALAGVDIRRGRYDSAMELLKDALVQNPDDPTALYNMAYIQRVAWSDKPASVRYYVQFLKVAPESDVQHRASARKALEEMSDAVPATSLRSERLLLQSRQASNQTEAILFAERAVSEDPLSADALWNLANRLAEDGRDHARTVRAFARFSAMFPDDTRRNRIPVQYSVTGGGSGVAANLNKARAEATAGRSKEAVQLFQRVLEADSANVEVWVELCAAAQKVPDWATAEKAARKALELKPDHPVAMYYLGTILVQRGQKREGFEYVRKYLNTLPDNNPKKKQIQDWLKRQGG